MQVEDVPGISFAAGRTPEQEHHLAVGDGVLGEVVVDQKRVLAPVHEELADGDVDAFHVLVGLVDDGIEQDRGLARLPVPDHELALSAPYGDHGVYGVDPGLQWLLDRLAPDDAGGHELDGQRLFCVDLAFAVHRTPERVDDAAEDALTNGNAGEALGARDGVALLDVGVVTSDDDADVVLLQVQGEAGDLLTTGVLELQHLLVHRVGQAVDARDAVPNLQNLSDLLGPDAVLVIRNSAFQDGGDLL